ncbi:hypothetical protein ACWDUN_20490 [Mycobacterium sp. NPDC003323]
MPTLDEGFPANADSNSTVAPSATDRVTPTLIDKALLDTPSQHELRAALRELLAGTEGPAVHERPSSNAAEDCSAWGVMASLLARAGVASDVDSAQRQRMWDTLSVAAQELGRVTVDVPFLTSSVAAATMMHRSAQRALTAALLQGATTAVFLTPYEQPFRLNSTGSFHDGRVWASVPGVAGARQADLMLILSGNKLLGIESAWAELRSTESLDATRTLADVTLSGAHATVLAEDDRALSAVARASQAASAMLAVEQASLAQTCLQILSRDHEVTSVEQLRAGVDKAAGAAHYAVQCLAAEDPHTDVAVATARMVCSTVSVRAATAVQETRCSLGRAVSPLAERARGSAMAFGGPQWHRRQLAQLITSPVSVDNSH